jgi:integrase/recombinase XerC
MHTVNLPSNPTIPTYPVLHALPAPEYSNKHTEVIEGEIVPDAAASPRSSLATISDDKPAIDLVAMLLQDKRSADTRRAYAADLRDFFGPDHSPASVRAFASLSAPEIVLAVLQYKNNMLHERGLSEATVNRRLAAIRSLLKFANRLGLCQTDGRNLVDGEKTKAYRDTRGVDAKTLKKLFALPPKLHARQPVRVLRDLALLGLFIENALRRAEVCKLNISDFEAASSSLLILGKGRGSQKERITLSPACTLRLLQYLDAAPPSADKYPGSVVSGIPLFRNMDRRPEYFDARLTPDGLYQLIGEYGRALGLTKLTPHGLRHSAITAALDATKGDVRRVQKLSRHSQIATLMIYDDNREDQQGQVSGLLSKLLK